jgi:hypothetical protein
LRNISTHTEEHKQNIKRTKMKLTTKEASKLKAILPFDFIQKIQTAIQTTIHAPIPGYLQTNIQMY